MFINSFAGFGSTGRIAAQQCRVLMAQGHECVLAYGRGDCLCLDVPTYRIGSSLDYRIHGLMTRLFDAHGFASKVATRRFLQWVREYDPDVIWLHNVHGYYINIELLFNYIKTSGKTIRWTLHDCWTFTGHCAYFTAVKCAQWQDHCAYCCQLQTYPKCSGYSNVSKNFNRKRAAFTGVPNMTLVVPSKWLADLVKQSFLKEYPVEVHYNQIDTNVFKPTLSDFRERYGLIDKFVILGVASVWSERKGLYDFYRLAQMLDDRYAIVLVGLTPQQIDELPQHIRGLQRTNNTQDLAAIYTAADVYVCPSKEETFGLTPEEARACGTPSIVYEDTACAEVAQMHGNMVVEQSPEAIYQAITGMKFGGVTV